MHRYAGVRQAGRGKGPSPPGQLEAVLQADDRVPVHDSTRFPWRAICHLECRFPTGIAAAGTCALVHSALALTAAHCVFDRRFGGFAAQVFVSPGRRGAKFPFGTHRAQPVWVPEPWRRWHRSWADVALLELERPVGNATGWFGLAVLDARLFRAGLLNLCGYPVDMPPDSLEERGKRQYWSATRVVSARGALIRHLADTYYGQSGSPIWTYGREGRWIVAVHTTGSPGSNAGTRVTRCVLDQVARRVSA